MRRIRRQPTPDLIDLFTPPPQRPTWHRLPERLLPKVTELLAELLRAGHAERPHPPSGKEVADE